MDWITDPQAWIAFFTLTSLEIVLGIDNVIFISILAGKLPPEQQGRARVVGLGAALVTRLLLLFSISWIVRLTEPLFSVMNHGVSGRDLILLIGGLFLIAKSTHEIHSKLEGEDGHTTKRSSASFVSVIIQIMLIDVVFSLDSVITAVGMVDRISIMVTAVIVAVAVMMIFASGISRFVNKHPTIKVLALSFLILIGVMLTAEGLHQHIPKGYVYFAMAFSVLVEMLNIKLRKKTAPVNLHEGYTDAEAEKVT